MKIKSYLTLLHRSICRHPRLSKGVEVRLDFFTRKWGLRYKVSRLAFVCKCVECGQPMGTASETETLIL